jgi:hypothetical protein
VTAISLLVSPIWFNLMERVEELATEGLGSYKEALAQAYEDELDGVENVVWSRARAIARCASRSTSAAPAAEEAISRCRGRSGTSR